MKPNNIEGIHDCSNCRHSRQVAPYKVLLRCQLDMETNAQPHTCNRWESLLFKPLDDRGLREKIASTLVIWYGDHNVSRRMIDRILALLQPKIEGAERAGIREVVGLIDRTGLILHTDSPLHKTGATILDCPACCWYAYKKEWGIE